MGKEFIVDSLEDMCATMCDNNPPEEKEGWWVFTFGCGQSNEGYYVKIKGTCSSARAKMVEKYGQKWAFQYNWEEWQKWVDTKPWYVTVEKELGVIE